VLVTFLVLLAIVSVFSKDLAYWHTLESEALNDYALCRGVGWAVDIPNFSVLFLDDNSWTYPATVPSEFDRVMLVLDGHGGFGGKTPETGANFQTWGGKKCSEIAGYLEAHGFFRSLVGVKDLTVVLSMCYGGMEGTGLDLKQALPVHGTDINAWPAKSSCVFDLATALSNKGVTGNVIGPNGVCWWNYYNDLKEGTKWPSMYVKDHAVDDGECNKDNNDIATYDQKDLLFRQTKQANSQDRTIHMCNKYYQALKPRLDPALLTAYLTNHVGVGKSNYFAGFGFVSAPIVPKFSFKEEPKPHPMIKGKRLVPRSILQKVLSNK